jgi:hypothetical protein
VLLIHGSRNISSRVIDFRRGKNIASSGLLWWHEPKNLSTFFESLVDEETRWRGLSAGPRNAPRVPRTDEADSWYGKQFDDHIKKLLAERFRNAADAEEVKRLGDQMGRMVFGNTDAKDRDVGCFTARRPQHLIDRMKDRVIDIKDLNQLRLWVNSTPEVA